MDLLMKCEVFDLTRLVLICLLGNWDCWLSQIKKFQSFVVSNNFYWLSKGKSEKCQKRNFLQLKIMAILIVKRN